MKKKALFAGLAVATLTLAGCGGNGGNSSSSKQRSSSSAAPATTYEVKIDDGNEVKTQQVELGAKIEKPANPTAPDGKVFYGWMNVKNGGQIWNFEDDTLGAVMEAVELKPLFVPANQNAQVFEAELCPDISEKIGKDGTPGMDGVTYSGGQKGLGLVGRDYYEEDGSHNEFGASGLYVRNEAGVGRYATQEDLANPDVAPSVFGGFVHYNYEKGNTLTWELESDVAAENVTIFMRVSGEYGLTESHQIFEGQGEDRVYEVYDDKSFPVTVNGVALEYGTQIIHNIVPKTFITFQDFFLGATVSLKAGKNTIQMTVDNKDTINGTIASTAPVVDCIKVFSSSQITWPTAKISQTDKSGAQDK